MKSVKKHFFIILICFSLMSENIFAAGKLKNNTGEIISVKGNVLLKANGMFYKANEGDTFSADDIIYTGKKSEVKIKLGSAEVLVREMSGFKFTNLIKNRKGEIISTNLLVGNVLVRLDFNKNSLVKFNMESPVTRIYAGSIYDELMVKNSAEFEVSDYGLVYCMNSNIAVTSKRTSAISKRRRYRNLPGEEIFEGELVIDEDMPDRTSFTSSSALDDYLALPLGAVILKKGLSTDLDEDGNVLSPLKYSKKQFMLNRNVLQTLGDS